MIVIEVFVGLIVSYIVYVVSDKISKIEDKVYDISRQVSKLEALIEDKAQ